MDRAFWLSAEARASFVFISGKQWMANLFFENLSLRKSQFALLRSVPMENSWPQSVATLRPRAGIGYLWAIGEKEPFEQRQLNDEEEITCVAFSADGNFCRDRKRR